MSIGVYVCLYGLLYELGGYNMLCIIAPIFYALTQAIELYSSDDDPRRRTLLVLLQYMLVIVLFGVGLHDTLCGRAKVSIWTAVLVTCSVGSLANPRVEDKHGQYNKIH